MLDGSEHESTGDYTKAVKLCRIAMTWRWTEGGEPVEISEESIVKLDLWPIDTGTELNLHPFAPEGRSVARQAPVGLERRAGQA